MSNVRQLQFECPCGMDSLGFDAMFQTEDNELCVSWICEQCRKPCLALVAGIKPTLSLPLPVFTEEDKQFLKENHCHLQEEA